jgi:hypothetical protein
MEIFPPREIDRQPTTVYHAIHHNFTTKTPRQTPTFPKTTLKNAHKTSKATLSRHPQFFLK